MINHPNRSNLSYPSPAPVFDSAEPHHPEVIGQAKTAADAMTIYAAYFVGTGAKAIKALKATSYLPNEPPVDGWVPELADE